ncbi:MAG: hypothetical protein EI684_19345 [Candidatus Viridilinea halotolerans]|uniref:Uncharacterized protein n=1 Tax=Candidatus Viridilinea halotolerans TaxID=2491704 RepID=A0A426TSP2_9CHLR|nr:MAG: hypothetical protein EI684_19345 [Candidatus Viridilinea halotolerans]
MYNGDNGGGGNYTRIGGFAIKPMYLYIAGIIAVLVAVFLVMRFLNTSLVMHFGAYAGALLLIGNLRELIGQSYGERGSIALLNVMVGGALLFAWVAQFFGAIFWLPALLLAAIATPLIFGRGAIYRGYITAAHGAVDTLRRTVRR